jgi:plastocyanin
MHKPGIRALAAALTAAAALAGCGGGGGKSSSTPAPTTTATATSTPAAGASTLSLSADPSALKFDKSALSASAGKVTIDMKNPSSLQHNIAIEGNGVDTQGKIVGQGGTSTVSATLKPGTYTFYCAVDGHRQAGMEGTLTVK